MLETDFYRRPLSAKKRLAIFKTRTPQPSFGIAQEPELPIAPSRPAFKPAQRFGPGPQPLFAAGAATGPLVPLVRKPLEWVLGKTWPVVEKHVAVPFMKTVMGGISKLPFVSKQKSILLPKGQPGPTDIVKTVGSGVAVVAGAAEAFELGGGLVDLSGTAIEQIREHSGVWGDIGGLGKRVIEIAAPIAIREADRWIHEEAELAPWTPRRPFRKPEVSSMGHPDAGTALELRPRSMGLMPGPDAIVKQWHANGINFWRTVDGWIYVQRLDGTIKRYRPYKSVVLGKRPSSKQVNRAINKLKSEHKIYRKLTALFAPKRRS